MDCSISNLISIVISVLALVVLVSTRGVMKKERFENTFFKLFDNMQKLLVEVTASNNYTNDIKNARDGKGYSQNLRLFLQLSYSILKHIEENKEKNEMYINIIRPLFTQEILSLLKDYVSKNNLNEYKGVVEKFVQSGKSC